MAVNALTGEARLSFQDPAPEKVEASQHFLGLGDASAPLREEQTTTERLPDGGTQHSPTPRQPDLHWLVRYARHCGYVPAAGLPMEQALRRAFGAPAWRILCRSPKERFMPILRARELSIWKLMDYCQRLAEHRFVYAPKAMLLHFFVIQRRLYFDQPVGIPEDDDYVLMRVADREAKLKISDIALVANLDWASGIDVSTKHQWKSLVRKAKAYRARQRLELLARRTCPWHFHCRDTPWRGYWIEPITNSAELWSEGMALGSCLYRLRSECGGVRPSRFFSVRRGDKRIATLELNWTPPAEDFVGMDRVLGRWILKDLRLSFNRLPDRHLLETMEAFATMYSFWAKRPGRMPEGHLEDIQDRITKLDRQARIAAAFG